ncbi:MAG: peptide chain release factor 1 [Bdellovibrionales bacterium RIFOXYD12_FULL_39_22]|nr:MAG: peptide chain release factor 1 [Bdellovibrionales bacterium RIFOXYB1_FULL_39_21]OFZ45216.1 MAG: peptide chain release factor 1 [Bdellovibrionales bacterium RIFOXYC12_FULL_39_17]OFZ45591.1 MAG: peptide chain release factor 1 [Bdellovibrionales bacterium RIFOXYC1_FULL_39_130]OFZ70971.1 MAG: peptide chain release factor 1 [Bdellovibrionales bacterium RIFOXYC2_FULL_39_8]OFZ77453.1 MAG: peptide chain release factor 1 [Bdellovibrionales bacterium RIFOXYD1_FULL_39_84]OFZ91582.1 MAG: peptide c
MFNKLDAVVQRFEQLTEKLADPSIYDRQEELKKVSEERANIEPIVEAYKHYKKVKQELEESKDLIKSEKDGEMIELLKEEIAEKNKAIPNLESELKVLLLPKDPDDDKNVMVEIRAGAGGDEASIFVGDVYRMYQNFLKELGFKSELVSVSKGDEGLKEIIFSINGPKAFSMFKYEGGVHRVQRVPKTEAQGRIHTSTITVAVMPEVDEVEFELNMNEVRIDVYRSGGSGGQSVNTTDSAVRVTHLPTGMVVAIQDEKSQIKNKAKALKILRNRIHDQMIQEQKAAEDAKRLGMVGRGDRSERIRTYNFPQGRLTDHRIGLTLYSLDKIIEGDMRPVIDALIAYNQAQLLKGQED